MLRVSLGVAFCLAAHTSLVAADLPPKPHPASPTPQPAKSAKAAHTPSQAVVQLRTDAPAAYPTTPYPAVVVTAAASSPKPAVATSSRKQLEASLQSVANLDYGDRKTVTVKEVLDDLHRQHHLSIRFDMPTLSTLLSIEPMSGVLPDDEDEDADESKPYPPAPIADPPSQPEKASPADSTASLCEPVELEVVPAAPEATPAAPAAGQEGQPNVLDMLMKAEVKIEHIDLKQVTIATVLRHTCDALPVMSGLDDGSGLPIKLTNASIIDYVVEDDGLLITTRMNAMTVKETRVYSIKKIKDVKADELAKVIRQSIRPWSWRSQINDLGDQLKAGLPTKLPPDMTASLLSTGMQLMSGASSLIGGSECSECVVPFYAVGPICTAEPPMTTYMPTQPPAPSTAPAAIAPPETYGTYLATVPPPATSVPQPNLNAPAYMPPPPTQPSGGVQPALTLQPYLASPSISISSPSTPSNCVPTSAAQSADANATALGINALVNALETFAHASLSAVEMVHFAEPPTGTIQTLPGKLIITQSQAAHREIADLLKQLEEE